MLDVITIGSAVEDVFLFLDPADAPVIDNPYNDEKRKKLIALEFGAKIDVKDAVRSIGGGGINCAVTFARAGLKTGSVLSIGKDRAGAEILSKMKQEKIKTKFVSKDKNLCTGFSTLIVAGKAKKDRVVLSERGASDKLNFDPSNRALKKANYYYLTALSGKSWTKELDDICSVVRGKSIKLAWNPGSLQLKAGLNGLKKYLQLCEVFVVNKDEAIDLVGKGKTMDQLLKALLDNGAKRVIISQGIEGVYYADSMQTVHAPANKSIKAKEATGAGDAFGSAFTASLIKDPNDIKSALKNGIRNSESVIQKIGAQEGIIQV